MKIKVLLVMPNKEVQVVKIPASTKFIKAFIGDDLYRVKLNETTVLIANKNAKVDEFNRILGENILLGIFLIVSIKNNHRVSMKKKDIRKFTNMFKLRKHQRKVELYKDEYLEEYYTNQRIMKQKNAERNKREIFKMAA
jgi:predicted RNA-binding protein with PUA domain